MGSTLSGEALRSFRHDLRTPLNHIIGFTDIMIEDAEERRQGEPLDGLRRIRAGGYELLARLQEHFSGEAVSVGQSGVVAAQDDMEPRIASLIAECRSIEKLGAYRDLPDDLDLLRTVEGALAKMSEMLEAEVQNLR